MSRGNLLTQSGPRTVTGKARASLNSIKHGLTALALLPDEDPRDYVALRDSLIGAISPMGALEELHAQRVVDLAWRLKRVARVEAAMIIAEIDGQSLFGVPGVVTPEQLGKAVIRLCNISDALTKVGRYEGGLERSFHRELHALERLQARRSGQIVPAPVIVEVNGE